MTTTVSYGVLYYAFAVVVKPMEAELGWSRAQTSGAFSLALLVSGLAAIPVGRWVDRRGARALMTLGSIAGALLVLAWSRVEGLVGLYATFAGIGLASACVFYEVAFTVAAVWFRAQRARAILTITLVAGFASTIFVPLTTLLVSSFGWRAALAALAGLLALLTVPAHALALRRRPSDLGLEPDGAATPEGAPAQPPIHNRTLREALAVPGFRWLTLAFALEAAIGSGVAAHLVPLLTERRYAPALVAGAAGGIGAMQVLGRIVFTPVGFRVPLEAATLGVFALRLLALSVLIGAPGAVGVWAFVVMYGASNGALTLARAGLVAERYGAAHYGSISGAMASVSSAAQAIAPLGAGAIYTATRGYGAVLWTLLLASGLAIVAVLRASAKPESVRVQEVSP